MPAGRLYLAAVAGLAIATASAAWADRPTFAELFAKAEAQAAAGHRWSPPGDNMTETVAGMMDLIGTATPKQLEDLSALLEADAERLRQARESEAPRRPGPANTAVVNKASPQVADPVTPRLINPGAAQPGNQVAPQMANPVAPQLANPVAPQLANPVAPQLANPVAPQLANPVAPQPGQRAAELLARGRAAESQGDVSGARRIYATAVAQGSAAAARDLGRLYDPAYLKQTALGGIDPDPALARHWYERAVAMGDAEAGPLLQALAAR